MTETFDIAGYCRISVDEEMDRENTSIENQKAIIQDFVAKKFPGSGLTFFEDRDRSGYTFEQRESYQKMRPQLMGHKYDILVVKDFSRFARRNSRGLVELEDLRDAGVRIISIGDSIDYPTYDDWTAIQFRFLINEMPVTDASKKVKSVIQRRQNDGKWICAVPYGYVITNSKTMQFEIDEPAAAVVRDIYRLYNEGWGYKKIANHLTDLHIPTPRMAEKARKEAQGEDSKRKARPEWSIVTVQGILENDFYIGTLRQGKYTRKKINGSDRKKDESDHIVFENHHEPILDYRTFALAQEARKKRSTSCYRGIKIHDNVYSGFLFCGDCGQPMFSMSRRDLRPAYTCSSYHKRGLKGCTSHHTRVDLLDDLLKRYVRQVKENSADMLDKLNASLKAESAEVKNNEETAVILQQQLDDAWEELKATKRQRVRDVMKHPEKEELLEQTYDELEAELEAKISGLQNQIELTADKRNTIIQVNRIARTALDIFDEILAKDKLDKVDLELIIEKITVYEDHIEIQLKADVDQLLKCGTFPEETAANFKQGTGHISQIAQSSQNRPDKVFRVSVISSGDPLEIYTDNDGEVIFKKYSPIGELSAFATQYAEVLSKIGGYPVVVCDRDHVISVAGIPKKELLERRVSPALEEVMEQRRSFAVTADGKKMQPVEGVDRYALVEAPIIAAGDVCGSLMFIAGDSPAPATDTEIKLIQVGAAFLGRQMEE
ncbi:stage V sporulation T C-terminal domain-containing protein [Anaerotruncus massiliensis (ex Togo et al. 2019)]|uniref:stage V sporulation T C-terminal domain-containing protein n=1 Tax=Anaerotruncus massiliensis (ex Togo et al. 2019) TaxID=1673720 RepID=UPI0023F45A74|nr:stage V sporulation T C-terminal domain-containing protein [Anaerotruncus massiliensis (ex Togo et al. 2019)]